MSDILKLKQFEKRSYGYEKIQIYFFAALLAMMWLGINVYADEYDGLDFDYGSVLVQLKPQITDAVSMCSDPFEELNISDARCIFGDDASSISLFSDKTEPIIYVLDLENPSRENVIDTIEKLKAMPNIEYAEPNYNVYEFSEPNDTYYQNGKQAVLDLIGAKSFGILILIALMWLSELWIRVYRQITRI